MRSSIVVFLALVGMSALTVNCGGGSSSSSLQSSPNQYVGTSSPGDVWNFTLDRTAGTFSASTDAGVFGSTGWSMSGGLQVLTTGFLKLTVNSVTNGAQTAPSIPIDGTHNIAYALEVPGVALLVQPANGGPMITAVYNSGNCNTLGGAGFVYIRTAFGGTNYNVDTDDAYGVVTMNGNSSSPGVSGGSSFNMAGTSLTFNPPGTGTCKNGLVTFPGNITGAITATSSGVMLLDQGKGNGGVIVLGRPGYAISDVASLNFAGLVFHNNSKSISPVQVKFDANSVGTATPYTDVSTGALGSTAGIIKNLTIDPAGGYFDGKTFAADGTSNQSKIVLVMMKVSTLTPGEYKYLLFGIGEDAGTSAPYNILLVQQ